jgi:uncharacterized membrane protein
MKLLADKALPTIEVPGGLGPWSNPERLEEPGSILASIISMALGAMTLGAAIWFLFQVIISGYNYLSAGGDREKLVNAGRKLTNSIIGLTIVIAAYALIALMGRFFGIDFLDIKGAIDSLVANGG